VGARAIIVPRWRDAEQDDESVLDDPGGRTWRSAGRDGDYVAGPTVIRLAALLRFDPCRESAPSAGILPRVRQN
jgi:hypothetical protein